MSAMPAATSLMATTPGMTATAGMTPAARMTATAQMATTSVTPAVSVSGCAAAAPIAAIEKTEAKTGIYISRWSIIIGQWQTTVRRVVVVSVRALVIYLCRYLREWLSKGKHNAECSHS